MLLSAFRKFKNGYGTFDNDDAELSALYQEGDENGLVGSMANRAICDLIRSGNPITLKNFLETRSAHVNERDENGRTPLMFAAEYGRVEFVSLLLSYSADATAEDDDKCTALHHAARVGHQDVACELADNGGAAVDAADVGQWTPLVWACYKGHARVARELLSRGADVNARGSHQVQSLVWAAGRGHEEVIKVLLSHNAKVDVGDKYGTTALIWSARKGYTNIVDMLLKAGANVDCVGMYSWTPLLVATRGNFVDIVTLVLDKAPNVNAVDADGMAALAVACKEGFEEIAGKLLRAGAYANVQDRAGDTNLIHASKNGHKAIVEMLLRRYADVDIRGKEDRTCLHWAIDRGHTAIVKVLLATNPDLEVKTSDGDTALLRAVRGRNAEIIQMLLDRKAKVTAVDHRGDSALHVAMRSRSKAIVEILLRNPKHSQMLYRPNRAGETPYQIDTNSQKPILGQVFGARRLNTNEDSESLLGYDLYSSALADMLTEPTLSMPITVGLYAKWGSGKSFLLSRLRQEMKNFVREWVDPEFHLSPLVFVVVIHLALFASLIAWVIAFSFGMRSYSAIVAGSVAVVVAVIAYVGLFGIWQGSFRYDWSSLYNVSMVVAKHLSQLKLLMHVMFSHPPGQEWAGPTAAQRTQRLRLLFTDQTKVVTSAGGQNSVTQMIGSLLDAVESQYGKLPTRLYRAFRPQPLGSQAPRRWRRVCCLPYIVVYFLCVFALVFGIVFSLLSVHAIDLATGDGVFDEAAGAELEDVFLVLAVFFSLLVGLILVANVYTAGNVVQALLYSPRRHLQRTVARLELVKSEGYLQAVRGEVNLMLDTVRCLDAFTGQQSRLVVVVDGLDSCEQAKVLSVLDTVHMLFSDPDSPFIILLAIDPHVITKAIEMNLHTAFSDTSIGGNAYLRNIVHLPFFLQNSGLRKVKSAQQTAAALMKTKSHTLTSWIELDDETAMATDASRADLHRRPSNESSYLAGGGAAVGGGAKSKSGSNKYQQRRGRNRASESICSSIGSNLNRAQSSGPQDLTKALLTDDYFSDANPRSMRRLMNVLYVIGRLLKAFNIEFNWYHLASWINVTEQWPYRLSWIIYFADRQFSESGSSASPEEEASISLKSVYDRIKVTIPTQKDLEPLVDLDRDEKKLDTFLAYHKKNLTLADLKVFLPFTINLDPYIKKVIKEEIQGMEEMGLTVEQIFSNAGNNAPAPPLGSFNMASNPATAGASNSNAASMIMARRQFARKISTAQGDLQSAMPAAAAAAAAGVPAGQLMANPAAAMFGFANPMMMWPQAMNPYQPFGGPTTPQDLLSRPAFPQPQVPAVIPPSPSRKNSLVTPPPLSGLELPGDAGTVPLSQRSVEDVCEMLRSGSVNGLTPAMVETYCSAIAAQNLNGRVLYTCNLEELKSVLNMNFGDWEIFRMFIATLRDKERAAAKKQKSPSPLAATAAPPSPRPATAATSPRPPSSTSESLAGASQPTLSRSLKHQTSVEKQVSLEDAMISGLLSTLNEEAHEDILTEELREAREENSHHPVVTPIPSSTYGSDSYVGGDSSSARESPNLFKKKRESRDADCMYLRHSTSVTGGATTTASTSIAGAGGGSTVPTSAASSKGSIFNEATVEAGGGRSGFTSWASSQAELMQQASVPTSPTSMSKVYPKQSMSSRPQSTGILKKQRYLRDRLDSLTGSEQKVDAIQKSEGEDSDDDDDDDDPYAWLSKTAPASPDAHRRQRSESTKSNPGHDLLEEAAAVSMEKLSQVRRRLRHAINVMDPAGSIPAAHRADRPEHEHSSGILHGIVSGRKSSRKGSTNEEEKGSKSVFYQFSGESGDETSGGGVDDGRGNTLAGKSIFYSQDELSSPAKSKSSGDGSACSSPEHPTVAKRPSLTSSRGPPVQELFETVKETSGAAGVDSKEEGAKSDPTEEIMTAVLPDGQVMKKSVKVTGSTSSAERA